MSDNNLVKIAMEAATLVGLSAGIGFAAKKMFDKSFTRDPSSSFENYGMFTGVMAGSIWLKKYLEDQKIIPTNV